MPELILVRIFMTIRTVAEEHTPELLEDLTAYSFLLVTFNTFYILMAAIEFELCS